MKKQLPGWAVLLIITLVAGIALGITDALTREPIAEQERIQAENARKSVLKDAVSFEELSIAEDASVAWAYAGIGEDGQPIGYVAQKTIRGFGGDVDVIVGVNAQDPENLTLTGISVGGSKFKETAGLGARSKEAWFTNQFIGKSVPLKLIKNGADASDNTIDAITSATVTSNAVVNGVNDVVKYIKGDILGIAGIEMPERPDDAQVFSASAEGKWGPVYVEAAFAADDTITYISVGDENYKEDQDGGVREPEYLIQYIGKKAPLSSEDFDFITGATMSSTAVFNALNQAYGQASGKVVAPVVPDNAISTEVYAGGSTLKVSITAEDGKLTYLHVEEKAYGASVYAACAQEEALQSKFVGNSLPLSVDESDLYAFCTAVAVNKAYSSIAPAEAQKDAAEGRTASAEAMAGSSTVKVSITEQDGVLTGLSVQEKDEGASAFADTDRTAALQKFVGNSLPLSVEESDPFAFAAAVAVNKAYAQIAPDQQQPEAADTKTEATAPAQTEAPTAQPAEPKPEPTAPAPTEPAPAKPEPTAAAPVQDEKTLPIPDGTDLSGDSLVFFTAVKATVSLQDGVIASATVSCTPVGGEYGPVPQADRFSELLTGMKAPVSANSLRVAGVPDYLSAAVALAVNDACRNSLNPSTEGNSELAVQPASDAAPGTGSGYSMIFFTAVKATAEFDGSVLSAFILESSAAGENAWEPMDQEQAYLEALTGKAMPLSAADVRVSGDALDRAVMIALNEAYASRSDNAAAQTGSTPESAAPGKPVYTGECLIFFDRVTVQASFEDGRLTDVSAERANAASGESYEAFSADAWENLTGEPLPLDAGAYRFPGVEDYLGKAVVIAVNQAYEESLAGQQ